MTTEETTEEEETTYVKVAPGGDVRGGKSSQSVDAEQLTSMSHEESTRFVIKSVIDPRTASEISMDQVHFRSLSLCNFPCARTPAASSSVSTGDAWGGETVPLTFHTRGI